MLSEDGLDTHEAPRFENQGPLSLVYAAISEAISALDEGRRSEIGAAAALRTTEVLFGTYESVRRQGRVDLPLNVDDHPLEALLQARDATENEGLGS